nr:MAG TPA: Integrase [Caudoviricetes sp.]
MAIEKLKSGHYRIRFEKNKKKYSITTDRKPTKSEEAALIHEFLEKLEEEQNRKKNGTFLDFANEYIASKEKVLSASTILGYKSTLKGIQESFTSIPFYEIEQHDITRLVNDMVDKAKPKTIYNRHGLVVSVLKEFRPTFVVHTKLPRKEQKDIYTPSEKEVKALFAGLNESEELRKYYIPVYLAAMGLRRSEIGALTLDDLSDDNIISITKAKVKNSEGKYIVQPYTKTERSNRKVPLSKDFADKIRQQGYIVNDGLHQIYEAMIRVEKKLGLPHFGIHRLRSYFASKAHALGIQDSIILTLGGWKTDNVMKNIYRKALNEDLEIGTKKYLEHMEGTLNKK